MRCALEPGRLPGWFVVLPDNDASRDVADVLRDHASDEVTHPSGRPWLFGRCSTMAVGVAPDARIAVVGQHALSAAQLDDIAQGLKTVCDVDRFARSIVGSAHLVASVAGDTRVQGTITSLRRVFFTRLAGVTVASDSAEVAGGLVRAELDVERLALHLLDPTTLYPLAGRPVWRGVEEVVPAHYLSINREGRHRSVRWWRAPDPVVPMAEGALALRDALTDAVGARTAKCQLVSADLGGVDSTALCSLAARASTEVVAYTVASLDPVGDDVQWARRTVAALGNVEHHVVPAEEMPLKYSALLEASPHRDEPYMAAVDGQRWLTLARRAAQRGSSLHFSGFGGDELLWGAPAHLHSLLRVRPRAALGHLRGFAAKERWPLWETVRQLAQNGTYSAWLHRVADDLTVPPPDLNAPALGWGTPPRLPRWVTPAAVDMVREVIRREAGRAEPLSPHRGQHYELEVMRCVTRVIRHLALIAAELGLDLAAPYYDDRVIESALAVRPEDRITPWEYKPLLSAAMAGIVPRDSLRRPTKADGGCEVITGLQRHREKIVALADDSRLVRLGLVDDTMLREACSRPLAPEEDLVGILDHTLACEVWLRSLEGVAVSS